MAETTNADLVTNGGRISELLAPDFHRNVYDPTDLRALMPFKMWGGVGSATMATPTVSSPGAASAASSETSGGFTSVALSTGEFSLTPSLYSLVIEPTDLLAWTDGGINVDLILDYLVEALGLTFTDLLAAAFANLSNSEGSTTGTMKVDYIYDAQFQLSLSNVPVSPERPITCVLHPKQMNELVSDLRNESGANQFQQATADMLGAKSPGFQGRWNNINFIRCDSVTSSGGARRGGMIGFGSHCHTLAPWQRILQNFMINPQDVIIQTPEMFIERVRDGANSKTDFMVKFYPAVAEAEDARGVLLQSVA